VTFRDNARLAAVEIVRFVCPGLAGSLKVFLVMMSSRSPMLVRESRQGAAARAGVCKVELDKGFQPLRDIRVDLSGPVAPSLDGGLMLIGPAREFGSAPAEDDQTAFKAIGGHVSVLDTFD
jgi:hypothetical protein